LEQLNSTNTRAAEGAAVSYYKDQMNELFGSENKCLMPTDFAEREQKARNDTVKHFYKKRTHGADDMDDDNVESSILEVLYVIVIATISPATSRHYLPRNFKNGTKV
jgi:hypothetical protein